MKTVLHALALVALVIHPASNAGANNTQISANNAAPDFAGHYYLSGIREVGSELVLRPDGTYAWALVYGSEDQHSKGTWVRAGGEIVLTAERKPKTKAIFSLNKVTPWNEDFEQLVLDEYFESQKVRVRDRYPFLQDDDDAPVTINPPIKISTAKAAIAYELTARTEYENAAASAMSFSTGSKAQISSVGLNVYRDIAQKKRYIWQDSLAILHQVTKQPWEKMPEAKLPWQCTPAQVAEQAGQTDPSKWTKAVGVSVADTTTGLPMTSIQTNFTFADGSSAQRNSGNLNRTWAASKEGIAVKAVAIKFEFEGAVYEQELAVPPTQTGVIHINFPLSEQVSNGFDEMRLKIEGKSLVGFSGRGRYDRVSK
jgi:hypothetical protein